MSLKKGLILIAEDSPTQKARLNYLLTSAGYTVIASPNGKIALDEIRHQKVDLVISDIVMPEMNGCELCNAIKEDSYLQSTPVLLLTSVTESEYLFASLKAGADFFITKPYKDQSLLKKVNSIIEDPENYIAKLAEKEESLGEFNELLETKYGKQKAYNFFTSTFNYLKEQKEALEETEESLIVLNNNLNKLVEEKAKEIEKELKEQILLSKQLSESENRFQIIIKENSDGIVLVDEKGIIKYANPAAEILFNKKEKDLIGEMFPFNITKNDLEEFEYNRDDNNFIFEIRRSKTLWNKEETFICGIRDITERKRIENELFEIALLNQSIFTTIPFPLHIVNGMGEVQFMNEKMEIITDNKTQGRKCWESNIHGYEKCAKCILQNEITLGETNIIEINNEKFGKSYEVTHTGMMYKGKKCVMEIFIDITERNEKEQELIKSKENLEVYASTLEITNKELEEFSYVAAHDLKSPISNLKGLITVMESCDGIKEDSLIFFDKVKLSVDLLNKKVESLNKIIMMTRNNDESFEFLSFDEIFSEIMDGMNEALEDQTIKINIDFLDCPTICYPRIHLQSIMTNLLTNAIKYRKANTELQINVKTLSESGRPCLIFEDNGLGIDLVLQKDKLFGLFKRFHTHVEGTGIGLHLVNSIVKSHKGKIHLQSEVNKGTTFKILLSYEEN